jgi:hypothetical protein
VRSKLYKRIEMKFIDQNYPAAKGCQDNPANVVGRDVGLKNADIVYLYYHLAHREIKLLYLKNLWDVLYGSA